ITAGQSGSGTITVSNGAVVAIDGTAVAPGNGTVGIGVGGNSSAGGGTGVLNITSGGSITIAGQAGNSGFSIRRHPSGTAPSTGTVNISGGGQLLVSANGTGSIGHGSNSTGTVNVDGAGSVLNAGSYLGVGYTGSGAVGGSGTLALTNGGVAQAGSIVS